MKKSVFLTVFVLVISLPLPLSIYATFSPSIMDVGSREIPPPNIDLLSLREIPGKFKYFFIENYVLKSYLVTFNSRIRSFLFDDARYPRVLKGLSDYYFLGNEEVTDYVQNRNAFEQTDIESWASYLTKIDSDLATLDIDYQLVLGPNKHSVYPEFAPGWLLKKSLNVNRGELFVQLTRSGLRSPAIDLHKTLSEQKELSKLPLFYHTDTHWNEYGAAIGSKEVVRLALGIELPLFKSVEEVQSIGGDLARMMGRKSDFEEHYATVKFDEPSTCVDSTGNKVARNELDVLQRKQIDCTSTAGEGRALIFIDSFGMSMVPSISQAFSHTQFIWQYPVDLELVREFKPDVVIHLMVARKLQTLNPKELALSTFPSKG